MNKQTIVDIKSMASCVQVMGGMDAVDCCDEGSNIYSAYIALIDMVDCQEEHAKACEIATSILPGFNY